MLKNNNGFTLIEIIAVLVILGILAAVAVSKYMGMQEDAKLRAMEGALAEGISTMNLAYGKLMVSNSGSATTAEVATKATGNPPASNDFSYTFGIDGLVTVNAIAGSPVSGASPKAKQWKKPQ